MPRPPFVSWKQELSRRALNALMPGEQRGEHWARHFHIQNKVSTPRHHSWLFELAYRLDINSLRIALRHIVRYGDTDIFPHLPELAFFHDKEVAILEELIKVDLDGYSPSGAIEALAPKNRFSFRIAHQLNALDTLLLLACIVALAERIEKRRIVPSAFQAFSYRLHPQDDGQLFAANRTFKQWLIGQKGYVSNTSDIATVVATDISDFYSRINFHRLENLLDEIAPRDGAARFVKKHVKVIRAKQSFGLPIGGSAARALAELALVDTRQAASAAAPHSSTSMVGEAPAHVQVRKG